ncbi:MAG: DNA mismatch repair protein MutS [Chloroflexi bacterium]|nr:DNA mismatch repair protein MutS [Chloroflexota bacterium]
MNAFLLFRDRDFDVTAKLPPNHPDLVQDLELSTLFHAMAGEDEFLLEVAKQAVLSGLRNDSDTIRYRQDILRDCLNHAAPVRDMYSIAVEAIDRERKDYFSALSSSPSTMMYRSTDVMQMFVGMLKKLKRIADEHAAHFASEGFTRFFAMLQRELDEEYFARVQQHLKELKFNHGVFISAALGKGNKGADYILRKLPDKRSGWMERLFGAKPREYIFYIPDRDENGFRALSELQNRGINLAANALAQSNDHILSFFKLLRAELAFYIGCLNLQQRLAQKGEPLCFPLPVSADERKHSFHGLYDVCLTLSMEPRVVGNAANADAKQLVVITGANQGGKSTLLRGIGLAQLMMQCGMFVPAESFCAEVCDGLFTHYKREEDATMESGKFDEELKRMSDIVDRLTPNSMLLCNESFVATNEREGSEIARQIVSALLEQGTRIFFVTHLYEFARGIYDQQRRDALFLRAERQPDGTRTFKLMEGEPLQTSYGKDLYGKIFGIASANAQERVDT